VDRKNKGPKWIGKIKGQNAGWRATGTWGLLLYRQLGRTRFWRGFGRLGIALLGSLAGGILGILGPEPWAVDTGILAPLALFALLAFLLRGRGRTSGA
jgi:hypothetical protein